MVNSLWVQKAFILSADPRASLGIGVGILCVCERVCFVGSKDRTQDLTQAKNILYPTLLY